MLQLQRSAGNRAVAHLFGPRRGVPVQRMTRAADLGKLVSTKSAMVGLAGRSTFAQIRSTLSDYEKARTPAKQMPLLERLDSLVTHWMKLHGRSTDATDRVRREHVVRLQDEVSEERARVSRSLAQDEYLGGLKSTAKVQGAAPTSHPFTMLSAGGQTQVVRTSDPDKDRKARSFMDTYGLTDAEATAIRIFTAEDYTYMNPVTSNERNEFPYQNLLRKMEAKGPTEKTSDGGSFISQNNNLSSIQKERANKVLAKYSAADPMKAPREEGGLHSALAIQGLQKLPPFDGPVYRGERHSPEVFAKLFTAGQSAPRLSLMSTTHKLNVAENFATGISSENAIDAKNSVAVIITFTSTAGAGRDIAKLTAVESEGEVLLLPGVRFKTVSVQEIGLAKYAEKIKMASQPAGKREGQPAPTRWYEVICQPDYDVPSRPMPQLPQQPQDKAPGGTAIKELPSHSPEGQAPRPDQKLPKLAPPQLPPWLRAGGLPPQPLPPLPTGNKLPDPKAKMPGLPPPPVPGLDARSQSGPEAPSLKLPPPPERAEEDV